MGPSEPGGLILTRRCRDLRRALTPVAWTVLEEIALDAVAAEGRIAAATSVRRIAAQLDLDAGTVASALRLLRNRKLVELERGSGRAGRFGLSSYVVLDTPGIRLLPPCGDPPHTVPPHTVDEDGAAAPSAGAGASPAQRKVGPDQAPLDLGWSGS